jgi:hypothetical protein
MEDGVMMTPTRIVRLVGIAGLIGWLGMVGWVAKTSRAQNQGQSQPPVAAKETATLPRNDSAPPPIASDSAPPPIPPAPRSSGQPASTSGNSAALSLPVPEATSATVAPDLGAAPPPVALEADDPEKFAQSFVDRSRKQAEEHLKALTTEAEQLRARLAKLDSGIRRWERLLSALKSAQGQSITSTAPGEVSDLEPLKPGQTTHGRSDKRVKWASAGASPPPQAEGQPAEPARDLEPVPAATHGAAQGAAPAPPPAPATGPATPASPGSQPR